MIIITTVIVVIIIIVPYPIVAIIVQLQLSYVVFGITSRLVPRRRFIAVIRLGVPESTIFLSHALPASVTLIGGSTLTVQNPYPRHLLFHLAPLRSRDRHVPPKLRKCELNGAVLLRRYVPGLRVRITSR